MVEFMEHTEKKCLSSTTNVAKIAELIARVGQLGTIFIVLSVVLEHQ